MEHVLSTLHLSRMNRLVIFPLFLLLHYQTDGQLNYYEKGSKALYWGISLGLNQSNFSIDRKPFSPLNDSILNVSSRFGPGFNLGLIGNWQFNKYFDLRLLPMMVFGEKIIDYETTGGMIENRIKTTYLTFPLIFRFKSEPIKDWRLFILGGIKYDYNLVPQDISSLEPNKIRLKKHGLSYEYGIGLQYFFPYFIFSPELKFSHSFFNMMDGGQNSLNGTTINGLFPRTLTLSINFEG